MISPTVKSCNTSEMIFRFVSAMKVVSCTCCENPSNNRGMITRCDINHFRTEFVQMFSGDTFSSDLRGEEDWLNADADRDNNVRLVK